MPPTADQLRCSLRRAVQYHTHRRHLCERLYQGMTGLVLLGSLSTMGTILADRDGPAPVVVSALVLAVLFLRLLLDVPTRAWRHAELARRYREVEQEMLRTPEPTHEALRTWNADRLTVWAEAEYPRYGQ